MQASRLRLDAINPSLNACSHWSANQCRQRGACLRCGDDRALTKAVAATQTAAFLLAAPNFTSLAIRLNRGANQGVVAAGENGDTANTI